ncbi:hypothetical protein QUF80_11985 [Desulfococcaceae bacterium HSG8]|nr:hypothetical protein [Desulfococcaceae bacterium HSG8]
MEDLPGNLGKDMKSFTPPKPSKRSEDRTLLSVGSDGKVKRVRWLKPFIIIGIFLLVAVAATGGYFYFLYKTERVKNNRLQNALNGLQQEMKSLRTQEKESPPHNEVMPRSQKPAVIKTEPAEKPLPKTSFTRAESDDSTASDVAETGQQAAESLTKTTGGGALTETTESLTGTTESETEAVTEAEAADTLNEKKEKAIPVQSEKDALVLLRDFNTSYSASGKILIEFDVKNTNPDSGRISGHAIVVLKADKNEWLPLPLVDIFSGRPSGKEIGKPFSISNFKTLKFESESRIKPRRYKVATVFVFTETSELMLEKDFPVISE